ncbi:hypothetical protein GCM10023107_70270 [Actinoplanes octamycinicus]|nr:hypothetical protein Aoc01nite_27160 [Actinoplanes octamycinicus]
MPRQKSDGPVSSDERVFNNARETVADAVKPYRLVSYGPVNSLGGAFAFLVAAPRAGKFSKSNEERAVDSLTIAVYVDSDDEEQNDKVIRAADKLRRALGYDAEEDIDIKRGSIFRRSRAWLKGAVKSEEVQHRLVKVERALELVVLDAKQAEVDSAQASAVREIVESLAGVSRASVRVGSILVAKYMVAEEPVILVRNLSQLEIRALEKYPEIQGRPENMFHALAIAVSTMSEVSAEQGVVEGTGGS